MQFITTAHPDAPALRLGAHRRLGEHLEVAAKDSRYIETDIEAGHHLFEAGEYDRANELLSSASEWLQSRGRFREGLRVLASFLEDSVQARMASKLFGQLVGAIARAHYRLGEVEKATGLLQQAKAIGEQIRDPRIVQAATAKLEELSKRT